MDKLTIGQKIKTFRSRSGISQLELELLISDSPGTISRIENGKINPTKETLLDIARALKLTPGEKASLFNINIENTNSEEIEQLAKQVFTYIQDHYLQSNDSKFLPPDTTP